MRIAIIVVGALVLLCALVLAVGWTLPVRHRATREATFRLAPAELFGIVSEVTRYPVWRASVTRVEMLPDVNGHAQFRETSSDGAIPYEVVESRAPERRVTRIADPRLPFGGTWTYEFQPDAQGTTLRITEDGEVYNPVFRFMSRFVFSHTRTMDGYLRDLGARVSTNAVNR